MGASRSSSEARGVPLHDSHMNKPPIRPGSRPSLPQDEVQPERRRVEVSDPARFDVPADFEARDGDVLVVSYPEVTLPLPQKYATVKIGGWIYTRKLAAGDDLREQATKIYEFLSNHAKRYGVAKVREFATEFRGAGSSRDD